jgi:abequosyltransferase
MSKQTDNSLLTISIPTYNRATYLKRLLGCIYQEIASLSYSTEVIVLDNASSDNTTEVVKAYQDMGMVINYQRNSENIGADRNIGLCYTKATGKYVLAIGDDDVLLPGSLNFLHKYLSSDNDYGLIYLNFFGFKKDPIKEKPLFKLFNGVYKYKEGQILKKIRTRITFTSANIVKRKFISEKLIQEANGTNFTQLPGVINSIIHSSNNLYVGKYLLAQQVENSGGYEYLNVFGKNIALVVNKFLTTAETNKYKKWIYNELFIDIFPTALFKHKKKSNDELLEKFQILKQYYNNYPLFWIFNYPVLLMPVTVGHLFIVFVKVYRKLFKFYNSTHLFKKNIK